jgi:hypothetical protein
MTTTAALAIQGRSRALLFFIFLQLLDFTTTMLVFARGGFEANPVVRGLMPLLGPVGSVLATKLLICAIVWWFSRRLWVLYAGNAIYVLIVAWNTLNFLISS